MTVNLPVEAACGVLGAILCAASWSVDAGHETARKVAATGIEPSDFPLASLGELWRVLRRMYGEGLPLDSVSVAAELDRQHADAHLISRLHVLAHEVPVVSAAERYAQIVVDAASARDIAERATWSVS